LSFHLWLCDLSILLSVSWIIVCLLQLNSKQKTKYYKQEYQQAITLRIWNEIKSIFVGSCENELDAIIETNYTKPDNMSVKIQDAQTNNSMMF